MDQEDTMAAVVAPQRKKNRVLRWLHAKSATRKAKANLDKDGDSNSKTVDAESDVSLETDKSDHGMLDVSPVTTPPVMEPQQEDHRQEENPSEMEVLADFLADFGSCRCVEA